MKKDTIFKAGLQISAISFLLMMLAGEVILSWSQTIGYGLIAISMPGIFWLARKSVTGT